MPDRRGRPGRLPLEGSARITRRITTIAVLVGIFLAVGKWFVWEESHSLGILSSLVHSALDLFGAVSSYFAVRYAARPPDNEYRFGRGKAESFSAVFQVCLIVLGAFHLIEEVFHRVSHPEVSDARRLCHFHDVGIYRRDGLAYHCAKLGHPRHRLHCCKG